MPLHLQKDLVANPVMSPAHVRELRLPSFNMSLTTRTDKEKVTRGHRPRRKPKPAKHVQDALCHSMGTGSRTLPQFISICRPICRQLSHRLMCVISDCFMNVVFRTASWVNTKHVKWGNHNKRFTSRVKDFARLIPNALGYLHCKIFDAD